MWGEPLLLEDPWDEPDDPEALAGALGVNVAEGFETHEVAAAAADTLDGALLFSVAFPAKLHDWAFSFVAS